MGWVRACGSFASERNLGERGRVERGASGKRTGTGETGMGVRGLVGSGGGKIVGIIEFTQ